MSSLYTMIVFFLLWCLFAIKDEIYDIFILDVLH